MTIFTPEQFKAANATDDTAALQAACDAARAATGIVQLDGKEYRISASINVGTGGFTIRGVGYRTTSVASFKVAGANVASNDYTINTTGSRIVAQNHSAFLSDDSGGPEALYLRVEHLAIIGTGQTDDLPAFEFRKLKTATSYNQFIDVAVFRFGTGHDASFNYASIWRDCRANGCLAGFRLGWANADNSGGNANRVDNINVDACDTCFQLVEGGGLQIDRVLAEQDCTSFLVLQPRGNNTLSQIQLRGAHVETNAPGNCLVKLAGLGPNNPVVGCSDIALEEVVYQGSNNQPFVTSPADPNAYIIRLRMVRVVNQTAATFTVPYYIHAPTIIDCKLNDLSVAAVDDMVVLQTQVGTSHTAVATLSDGTTLDAASSLFVENTGAFADSGTLRVVTTNKGLQAVTYKAKSAGAFTGLSGGSGTVAKGADVSGPSTFGYGGITKLREAGVDLLPLDVRMFGARPGVPGGGDAIQLAIDEFIAHPDKYSYVWIPTGAWYITRGLLVGKRDGGPMRCIIRGSDNTFPAVNPSNNLAPDPALSGPVIVFDDGSVASRQTFVMAIQGAHGVSITGLGFIGANHAPAKINASVTSFDDSYVKTLTKAKSDYIDAGIRTDRRSPHACVVIDPFDNPGDLKPADQDYALKVVPKDDQYPDWAEHYGLKTTQYSSQIEMHNCWGAGGYIGCANSPAVTGNGAEIQFRNCNWSWCTVARSFGQSQSRGIVIENEVGCTWCWCWIDSMLTGPPADAGTPPLIISGADVGAVKYLFNVNLSAQKMHVAALYCEATAAIGRLVGACGAHFVGCNFNLLDVNKVQQPAFHLDVSGTTVFDGCMFNTQSNTGILRVNGAGVVRLRACTSFLNHVNGKVQIGFGADLEQSVEIDTIQIKGSPVAVHQEYPERSRWSRSLVDNGAAKLVQGAAADPTAGIISTSKTSNVQIGDLVRQMSGGAGIYTGDPDLPIGPGQTLLCPIGYVTNVQPNVSITIGGIGRGFDFTKPISLERFRWIAAPTNGGAATRGAVYTPGGSDDTTIPRVGDAVCVSAADTVQKANANSAATMPAIGIVTVQFRDDQGLARVRVVTFGEVQGFADMLDDFTPFTAGRTYFLDGDHPGKLSVTPPSKLNQVTQVVGIARNATTLIVSPCICDGGVSSVPNLLEDPSKWQLLVHVLFGAVGGGTGTGVTPGGQPVPIDPGDPFAQASPATRQALAGVAISKLSALIQDPKSRDAIQRAALTVSKSAIDALGHELQPPARGTVK